MELLERIEEQMSATGLPLVGITLAAVPCPDTPVILTLHWHGFITEKLADIEGAQPMAYAPIPSSALQVSERWSDLVAVDQAALDAAWRLGAWDVARAERPGCTRPGARDTEPLECLQAFGAYPHGVNGTPLVVSEAPDADALVHLAAQQGPDGAVAGLTQNVPTGDFQPRKGAHDGGVGALGEARGVDAAVHQFDVLGAGALHVTFEHVFQNGDHRFGADGGGIAFAVAHDAVIGSDLWENPIATAPTGCRGCYDEDFEVFEFHVSLRFHEG